MFLTINVSDVNQLAIHLPSEKLEYITQILYMVENNFQYIKVGYDDLEMVHPDINIKVSDELRFTTTSYSNNEKDELVVTTKGSDLPDEFVKVDSEAYTNFTNRIMYLYKEKDELKDTISTKETTIKRIQNEKDELLEIIDKLKDEILMLKSTINAVQEKTEEAYTAIVPETF